jgi:replicative DNA helicase
MTSIAEPDDMAGYAPRIPDQRGFERVPPQDLDAEQSVLGGMLLSKDAIGDVIDSPLQARDYYRPAHETIHQAILHLFSLGEPADPITTAAELLKRGELARVGGTPYLHTLVNAVPTSANAEYYAGIVHERAVLRRLSEAGNRISAMAYAAEGEVDDIRNAAEAELLAATDGPDQSAALAEPIATDVPAFWDALDAAMKDGAAALTGLPTGLTDLDSLTNGLQPGQLLVIGARPAMGKSTLALDITRSVSIRHGKTSAFFSLEMGRPEITQRIYSAEARVALHHIRSGTVTDDDLQKLANATPRIEAAPLIVDDSPNLTFMEIRSRARRIKQRRGLDLLVVDYLQLMESGGSRRQENRQQEVSDISRNLKLLAKELALPVIALSQLNRGSEARADKKPQLSDLRESGAIEQDADMVILLHREDAYEKETPRAGEADLIVAKHRNGPTATITTAFQGHYSRFVDMAQT